ncbi:glycosyl hydrolase family 76 [Sphingobacterium olei]|uniref:Glycosyl hydrolase family 76 n=1 Tax=Sphingobacterium olei TaxID=2571155 RepID=A0A4U0NDZ2_9SPHI|nr:glycoside hydrolase family 76 protein [Sphingobacterium olei]TJZ51752.1 glycosyl hydrolase family 76 [Sphingobacterium olei]
MKAGLSLLLALCMLAFTVHAQQKSSYLQRAEETIGLVWEKYRVHEHGLFAEYYPNSYKPDLTYFQEGGQKAKEVSYLWPMSGVFSAVNVLMELKPNRFKPYLDSMVIAVEQYLDKTRTPYGYQAYPSKFETVDRYYDDNGLVGIDYMDSYSITGDASYLAKAKEVMTFIESGWTDSFGGGVSWLEGIDDQKPACSNGKATVLALKIYQASGEEKYLHYAMKSYNWMLATLRDDTLGIIWNALLTPDRTTGHVQKHAYTYNTGTMIQSAVRLYKITSNAKYLEDAHALAEGSYRYYFDYTTEGIPQVKDIPWFTLVLFRGYHELYEIDQNPKYVDAVIERADWAWEHARDEEGLPCADWTGRKDEMKKPKWLLDTSCMAELYARIALIKNKGG